MTEEEFHNLQVGDQIIHPAMLGGEPVTIVSIHAPNLVVATISVVATNPPEWRLYRRCTRHEFPNATIYPENDE